MLGALVAAGPAAAEEVVPEDPAAQPVAELPSPEGAAAAVEDLPVPAPEPSGPPEPPEPNPSPYLESGGRVVIELETGSPTAPGLREWMPSGLSGSVGSAMVAGPDGGPAIPWATAPEVAPGISVPVRFTSPGVYHVWVRAWAPNPAGDSLHVGLDGEVQALSGYLTTKVYRGWNWFRTRINYPTARIVVDTPGLHTVHVWMREDGIHLDRMVLSLSPSAAPSGLGPAASMRAPA
ncbi:MAG: hypothetical protein AB7V62_00750 [Thermoleophilia bacterium]